MNKFFNWFINLFKTNTSIIIAEPKTKPISMPVIKPKPEAEIEVNPSLHPEFKKMIDNMISMAIEQGLHVGLFSGYRSFKEQNDKHAQGRTRPGKIITKAKGGESWHNYGLAADIVFKDSKGDWSWSESNDWAKLGLIGKNCGFSWGGDWKKFKDRSHFQYTNGMRLSVALSLFKEGGLKLVWSKLKF